METVQERFFVRIKTSGVLVPVSNIGVAVIGIIDGNLELVDDPVGQALINERLGRSKKSLTAEEKLLVEAHKDPDYWKKLGVHARIKHVLKTEWAAGGKRRGWLTIKEMLELFNKDPGLSRYQPTSLDARIRELADKGFEEPPFLFHFAEGERSGRYVVNPSQEV